MQSSDLKSNALSQEVLELIRHMASEPQPTPNIQISMGTQSVNSVTVDSLPDDYVQAVKLIESSGLSIVKKDELLLQYGMRASMMPQKIALTSKTSTKVEVKMTLPETAEQRKKREEDNAKALAENKKLFDQGAAVRELTWPIEKKDEATYRLNGILYRVVDHGMKAGDQTLACFYLSACCGDEEAAVNLKAAIAPLAAKFSAELNKLTEFGKSGVMADTECFLVYPKIAKRKIVVVREDLPVSKILEFSDGPHFGTTFVLKKGNHFCSLQPM